jgi:hypothetical protein
MLSRTECSSAGPSSVGCLVARARTDTNLLVQRDRRVGNGLREDVVIRN